MLKPERLITAFLLFCLLICASLCWADCSSVEPLFVIEHSKNGNSVRYEACLDGEGGLSGPEPVISYWVLEDGQREDLNSIERARAYGVVVRETKGRDAVRISLVSLKSREITVKKTGHKFTALMLIRGRECILERVFIKSHDLVFGIPVVEHIDLFGKTKEGGQPLSERINKSQL